MWTTAGQCPGERRLRCLLYAVIERGPLRAHSRVTSSNIQVYERYTLCLTW